MKPKILVVGSMNVDMCMYGLGGLPAWGTSTFATDYRLTAGGKGANQAFAVARLGGEVSMVGRVGDDDHGRLLRASLESCGVRTEFVVTDPAMNTGFCTMNMNADGQYFSIYVPGANTAMREADVQAALSAQAFDMILMQLEMPRALVYRLCEIGRETGIPIFLDAGPAMAVPLKRLRGARVISPNEAETEALTGIAPDTDEAAADAAHKIRDEAEPDAVLLKLGTQGAYMLSNDFEGRIPARRVDAVDTTAAGDTFSAAYCVATCAGMPIPDAVRYANAAAALCVTRRGGQPSIPEKREVDAYIAAQGE